MANDSAGRGAIETCVDDVLARTKTRWWLLPVQVVVVTIAFVVYVYSAGLWKISPRAYQMLFERGIWQYVTMYLAMLVTLDLLVKLVLNWLTRFDPARLEWPTSGELTVGDVERIAFQLQQTCRHRRIVCWASWPRTLALALLQYARSPSKADMRDTLQTYAAADEAAAVSRYSMVKLYLWAIPLIGFIGTVEGIGTGIGNFSVNLQNQTVPATDAAGKPISDRVDSVRESLNEVTSGLGRAFDTTYLALVLTVGLMIVTALLERGENDRDGKFQMYLQTDFAGRLPEATASVPIQVPQVQLVASTDNLEAVVKQTDVLTARLETLHDKLDGAFGDDGIKCRITIADGEAR